MLGVLANGKRALFESRHSAASHLLDVEGHCEVGADEKDVLRFQVSVSQFVVVQNWKVEKKKNFYQILLPINVGMPQWLLLMRSIERRDKYLV